MTPIAVAHNRAITMHRPSETFATCWLQNWHRHWLVVWSCPGSTTAMLCSTMLPATASRSCSEYRTTQLGSFSKHQDDPTLARCWGRYTGCTFSRGSTTKWLRWHSKSAAPPRRHTPCLLIQDRQQSHNMWSAMTLSTFYNDDFCKMHFSMLCTSCLELTTDSCSQQWLCCSFWV